MGTFGEVDLGVSCILFWRRLIIVVKKTSIPENNNFSSNYMTLE